MKRAFITLAIVASIITCTFKPGLAAAPPTDITGALSDNPAVVQQTITSLRDAGPAGLTALLDEYDKSPDPRLIPVIDAVAGQRDALSSRLYWYTDLAKASAAASDAHKPILYLRMLGKLTDEYSCANSRFFRTVLYANADVSKYMREHYILVWQSERPVPVVTIDFGEGRVLKRTLTGNSIHYIVTSHGEVVDALPGLYDPKMFVSILERAARAASTSVMSPAAAADAYLQETQTALRAEWEADARRVAPQPLQARLQPLAVANNPDARAAMRRAVSKTKVEAPLLAKMAPQGLAAAFDQTIDSVDEATWQKLASLHVGDATLDASSIALIRSQNPRAYQDPAMLDRTVQRFQQSIALDTVRNNYQLRRQILAWLSKSPGQINVEDLNRRVYAELFLTPRSDPWLGLMPESTYSGLNGDGCMMDAKSN